MSDKKKDLAILANSESNISQIMQAVVNLEKGEFVRKICFGLSTLGNVDLLGLYLRKQALMSDTRIDIVVGNYDDPIGDVELFQCASVEYIVFLPFFDNLLPSFEAQLGNLAPEVIEDKETEMRGRYRIAFNKARNMKAIYLGTFHRIFNSAKATGKDNVDLVLNRFNAALCEEAASFKNIHVINTEEIVRVLGQEVAFDPRFYFRNKAPFTGSFMNEFARRVAKASRGFGAHFFKVLVLDCDNTLWGGVIGEDLLSGIKLGPYDYPGNIFWRAQHEFAALEREGILICLCTKNNIADIEDVLMNHPEMVLRDSQFVIKKVNWNDKSSNIRELSLELNLGLESMVFLDDSSFECEGVRQQLPMVKTIQVPANLSEYPRVVQEIKELFLAGGVTSDSYGKTEHYRQRASAEKLKVMFESQEAYLASLGMKVELALNATKSSARISELSMKSNQFNLTTHRYSEDEIERMMQDREYSVYSLVVSDKFGNAGLTGVAVVRYSDDVAFVENFFMSCRVIGRGVEMSIWTRIFEDASKRCCKNLCAEFIPSQKNAQVSDFYDRLGLSLIVETNVGVRKYGAAISTFVFPETSWIEMNYVE